METVVKRVTPYAKKHVAFLCLLLAYTAVCIAACLTPSTADAASKILVLRPEGQYFQQVAQGIADGLEDEMSLTDHVVFNEKENEKIHILIQTLKPAAVVLMDNLGVKTYQQYQARYRKQHYPPSIVVATLFADRVTNSIENSTGILYEIPALTSLTNLRNIIKPVQRVGVIYRKNLEYIFKRNQKLAQIEQIELIGIPIDNEATKWQLSKGIKKLLRKNTDALWIMNDGNLLTRKLMIEVWIKKLKKYKKPVVVGIQSLIKTQFKFGDYTAFPDHYYLGQQTADILFELSDHNWKIHHNTLQEPISINKGINLQLLKQKGIMIPTKQLNEFDQVIK